MGRKPPLAARTARDEAILAHVRRYPGLTACEIGSAVLGVSHQKAGSRVLPNLYGLAWRDLVHWEYVPRTGRPRYRRQWYPGHAKEPRPPKRPGLFPWNEA
jgi:hypothetical protein